MSLLTNFQDLANAVKLSLDKVKIQIEQIKTALNKKADKSEIPKIPVTDVLNYDGDSVVGSDKKARIPYIPTVPSNVSAFYNDAGYLKPSDIVGKQDKLTAGSGIEISAQNVIEAKGYKLLIETTTAWDGDTVVELPKSVKSCVVLAAINKKAAATATMVVNIAKGSSVGGLPQVLTKATGNTAAIYEYLNIDMYGKTIVTHHYHSTAQSMGGTGSTEYVFINNQEAQNFTDFNQIWFTFSGNTTQAAGSKIQVYTRE